MTPEEQEEQEFLRIYSKYGWCGTWQQNQGVIAIKKRCIEKGLLVEPKLKLVVERSQ